MAIPVVFYNFSKKYNSTKRPDVSGTTYQCNLIEDCSIINPRIVIVGGDNNFNPMRLNYAFIASFDRHYYVNDWTYSNRTWIASLNIDVLASWRQSIGASNQYITRSNSIWNENIGDDLFPASNIIHTERVFATMGEEWYDRGGYSNFNMGFYVMAVLNNLNADVTEKNIVTYYAMTVDQFRKVSEQVFSTGTFWQQVVAGVLKFSDFILSLSWFPYEPSSMASIGDLRPTVVIGDIPLVDAPAYQIKRDNISFTYDFTINEIPKHPQSALYGKYMNCAPWSSYHLYYPPIGTVELDSKIISKGNSVKINISCDLRTGNAQYLIYSGEDYLGNGNFQFSADIPCSSFTSDFSAIGKTVTSLSSFGVNLVFGRPLNAVENFGGFVSNGIDTLSPIASVKGSYGNANSLGKIPQIYCRFIESVKHNEDLGKPLCNNYVISNLGEAFVMISDPHFSINCTDGELQKINDFAIGGFYYE